MKMAWGSGSFTTAATTDILFSTAGTGVAPNIFPGFTNPPVVQVTRLNDSTAGGGNFIQVGRTGALAVTNSKFNITRAASAGSQVFYSWLAIGF
jgi:hypothetical protein